MGTGVQKRSLYPYVMAAFCVIVVLSNIVAVKLFTVFGMFVAAGGLVLFPLSYILGDVVTEIYGYAGARKIFWAGLAANVLMVITFTIVDALPGLNPVLSGQFHGVLSSVPQIVMASMCGIWCGQFANAFVMSRMKVATKGRWLWMRTISSTLVGESIDTAVFSILAFGIWGTVPWFVIPTMIFTGAVSKTAYEIIATPLTYIVVNWMKRQEGEVIDAGAVYNPFTGRVGAVIHIDYTPN